MPVRGTRRRAKRGPGLPLYVGRTGIGAGAIPHPVPPWRVQRVPDANTGTGSQVHSRPVSPTLPFAVHPPRSTRPSQRHGASTPALPLPLLLLPPGPGSTFSSSQLPQLAPAPASTQSAHHGTTLSCPRYRDIEWNFDKHHPPAGIRNPTHRVPGLHWIWRKFKPPRIRGFKRMQRSFGSKKSSISLAAALRPPQVLGRLYVLHLSTYHLHGTYLIPPHTSSPLIPPSPQPHHALGFSTLPSRHPHTTPVTTLFNPTPLSPLDRHGSRHEPQHRSFGRNNASQFSQSHTCSPPLLLL